MIAAFLWVTLMTPDPIAAQLQAPPVAQYHAPDADSFQQTQSLFAQTLANPGDQNLTQAWLNQGFSYQVVNDLYLLTDAKARGAGGYLFRKQGKACLQVPHRFHDRKTGDLGLALFLAGDYHALAWNTASRKTPVSDSDQKADLAKRQNSYFQAFHLAWLNTQPGPILQLHGFAREKRKTEAGRQAHLILSNGTRFPSPWLRQAAAALTNAGFTGVALYGEQVNELGATTNVQARAARARNHPFLHLELSAEARTALCKKTKQKALHQALRGNW